MNQKLISRVFAIVVLVFGTGVLLVTGIPMPDPPAVIGLVFVYIGLGLELWKPRTEWKLQKKMLPLAIISMMVAVWTIFTFNILVGRYPGGAENPFDALYYARVPLYTLFIGTFFFGFFIPLYFLFKPPANAIVGGTIYNLMCLIICPIATIMGYLNGVYLEDYIMEAIGVAMFIYWYIKTPKPGRKFLGVNPLLFSLAVAIIGGAVLIVAAVIMLPPGHAIA